MRASPRDSLQQPGLDFETPLPRQEKTLPLRSYFVKGSTPTLDEALEQNKRNKVQEAKVLAFLRSHRGEKFTHVEIARAVGIARDNSCARALSVLLYERKKVLRYPALVLKHSRPEDKRMGNWRAKVCTWSAA